MDDLSAHTATDVLMHKTHICMQGCSHTLLLSSLKFHLPLPDTMVKCDMSHTHIHTFVYTVTLWRAIFLLGTNSKSL